MSTTTTEGIYLEGAALEDMRRLAELGVINASYLLFDVGPDETPDWLDDSWKARIYGIVRAHACLDPVARPVLHQFPLDASAVDALRWAARDLIDEAAGQESEARNFPAEYANLNPDTWRKPAELAERALAHLDGAA